MELFSFKCELLCLVVNLYAVGYNLDRKPEIQAATADLVWRGPSAVTVVIPTGILTFSIRNRRFTYPTADPVWQP